MRPRVFPAEDHCRLDVPGDGADASMRPRVFPAEDTPATSRSRCVTISFNEAAGIPRGRLTATAEYRPYLGRLQ